MKIFVLGTSNSVIGEKGYIKSLRLEHDVVNLSSGRVSCLSHISKIIKHRKEIEESDLLIVDHYINDVQVYKEALGEDYFLMVKTFYKILSSLNVNVLNVLFPFRSGKDDAYIKVIENLSLQSRLLFLNLNLYNFKYWHFNDQIHLNKEVSYILGIELSKYLTLNKLGGKPSGGEILESSFSLYTPPKSLYPEHEFKNSLVDVSYSVIDKQLVINSSETTRLVSIGYLNITRETAITINESNYILNGIGYFHEAILDVHTGDIKITYSSCTKDKVTLLGKKDFKENNHNYPNVTELLFFNYNKKMKFTQSNRKAQYISLPNLIEHCDSLVIDKIKLSTKTVDFIRDASINVQNDNLQVAYELMRIAGEARASGPVIKKYISKFGELLGRKNND